MRLFIDKDNRTVEDFDSEIKEWDPIPGIAWSAGPITQLANKRIAPLVKPNNLNLLIRKYEDKLKENKSYGC